MAIRKFTENVNVISALPDVPSAPEYNASILKAKFDEAAQKIKAYLNDTLVPDIENTAIAGVAAVKKLLIKYDGSGTYLFKTAEHPSVGGVYDVVLIGGGGGGSTDGLSTASLYTGGGSGAVVKVVGASLDGQYTISVGAGGVGGTNTGVAGGSTFMMSSDYSFFQNAPGGGASTQSKRIGYSGGKGGTDSTYGDGTYFYGAGGDNEYGRGARGAALNDDMQAASGYGAGGWGSFSGTAGAVLIYGYERV